LAAALDCTVTYLIGLTDEPHRWEPDPPSARIESRGTPGQQRRGARQDGPAVAPRGESLILGAGFPERTPRSWPAGGADR
jgi:hypothetical protein